MTTWLYWTYTAIMAAGTLSFLRWSRDPKGIPQTTYRLPVAILIWSGFWHAIMAFGWGEATSAGRPVHWARFVEWMVSVPLLMIALAVTATYAAPVRRRGLIATLAAVNFLMILFGLGAEAASDAAVRLPFYGAGLAALVLTLALVRGPLWATAQQQPAVMAEHFRISALLLCVAWVSFPVVWILGPSGLDLLDDAHVTALFLALSVLVKLGWSMFDVGRLRGIADRGDLVVAPGRPDHAVGPSGPRDAERP